MKNCVSAPASDLSADVLFGLMVIGFVCWGVHYSEKQTVFTTFSNVTWANIKATGIFETPSYSIMTCEYSVDKPGQALPDPKVVLSAQLIDPALQPCCRVAET